MTRDEQRRPRVVAVIDDEQDVVMYFRIALEDHGYRVVATTDPAQAVELLERSRPDLVCLDLLMPERTGISLYSTLTRHPRLRHVPVVILTGLAVKDELPAMLKEAGGLPLPVRFIEKPAEIEQFLAVVDEILEPSGAGAP